MTARQLIATLVPLIRCWPSARFHSTRTLFRPFRPSVDIPHILSFFRERDGLEAATHPADEWLPFSDIEVSGRHISDLQPLFHVAGWKPYNLDDLGIILELDLYSGLHDKTHVSWV